MSGTFDPKLGILRELTSKEEARRKAKKLSVTCVKLIEEIRTLPLEELSIPTLTMLCGNTSRLPEFIKVFNGKLAALISIEKSFLETLPQEKE